MESGQEHATSVAVNFRPPLTSIDDASGRTLRSGSTGAATAIRVGRGGRVEIGDPKRAEARHFDRVYGEELGARPRDGLYAECVEELVVASLQGFNSTVLAYGQTGTGKTFTMGTGGIHHEPASGGIVPRAIEDLFAKAAVGYGSGEATFSVSFLELHLDQFRDLLGNCKKVSLRSARSGPGGLFTGLTTIPCEDTHSMVECLRRGACARAKASTAMNRASSRSHAVFTVYISTSRTKSKIQFVDLAGSERISRSKATGQQQEETKAINKALLALGNVIAALSNHQEEKASRYGLLGRGHVPYRDSKLTQLLEDSLGGNCRTCMIAFVSSLSSDLAETASTLTFAARACATRNVCHQNWEDCGENASVDVSDEVKSLRLQLDSAFNQLQTSRTAEKESKRESGAWRQRAEDAEASLRQLRTAERESEFTGWKRRAEVAEARLLSFSTPGSSPSRAGCQAAGKENEFDSVGSPLLPYSDCAAMEQRKLFVCEFCGKGFPVKSNFTRHVREVHAILPEERPTRRNLRSSRSTGVGRASRA